MMVSAFGISTPIHAQTFGEWFKQKKTQKKYLAQQIALLQLYLGYLKKGYTIVNDGVTTVNQIKHGEFNLHDLFYTSKRHVNPEVRKISKVTAILVNQRHILDAYRLTMKNTRASPYASSQESDWLYTICGKFLKDVSATVDELMVVLTDGKMAMSDDERVNRIDQLYKRSKKQVVTIQQLSTDVAMLGMQQKKEQYEVDFLRELY